MPFDLTKQRLYTTRIPDSRYPYGAFNTSYQNGVFTAILRDDLIAGDVYMRVVKQGDEEPINYRNIKKSPILLYSLFYITVSLRERKSMS